MTVKMPFNWPVRVYYEDTDAGGVVFYANYLRFMERARSEWLRSCGFEQDQVRDEYNIVFAVRSVDIKYLKPARFNDQLNVRLSAQDVTFQSFWSGVSEFNGLVGEGTGNWDSRFVSVSLNYTLGNNNVKSRKRKTGIEAESNRVGEGGAGG